jgi:7,8-dihydropterin-6-yl-methyl-4-(beta-D-ribofuranosyl)aminobenzene 5'-phosphate synthase
MKITLLCENSAGLKNFKVCLAEWGFSAYVEVNGVNILFDTGHTEVYRHNAKGLGIDLNKIDFVALSHRHWDHTGGIQLHDFKTKKKLILHPGLLAALPESEAKKIKDDFDIIASKEPLEFSQGIYFLGQIPRVNDFEKGEYKGDKMLEDSAIAIKTPKGAIVIAGCSHSGIVNICEYAKQITGQKLYAVIGGFHLFEEDAAAVSGAIEYFKREKPEFLYPMHCVDFPTMARFYSVFGIKKLSAGDAVEFDV